MITICSALMAEVSWLKTKYEMEKIAKDLYISKDGDIRLLICGIGPLESAINVASLLAADKEKDHSKDILINVGCCGADVSGNETRVGEIFRVNKITDKQSDKVFYPDMIISSDFKEAEIITDNKIYRYDEQFDSELLLHDEEAAGIYQAGLKFLKQHQMIFLKVVSDDSITKDKITLDKIIDVMEKAGEEICLFIDSIRNRGVFGLGMVADLNNQKDYINIDSFVEDIHASVSMQARLNQCFKYAALAGVDINCFISEKYEKGHIPCKDKKAGKKIMDELEEYIVK